MGSDPIQTTKIKIMEKKEISILIPTINNLEYIQITLDSIIKSCEGFDYEILIGIDSCQETLQFFRSNKQNDNVKTFFSEKNVGAYVIRNSLVLKSTKKNILFFDSDDIMGEKMIETVLSELKDDNFIRSKHLRFYDDGTKSVNISHCQICLRKEVFLNLNGFEPWPITADTDLIKRLEYNKFKPIESTEVLFNKRMHKNSLTQQKNTGFGSPLRNMYVDLIKKRSGKVSPKILTTTGLIEL